MKLKTKLVILLLLFLNILLICFWKYKQKLNYENDLVNSSLEEEFDFSGHESYLSMKILQKYNNLQYSSASESEKDLNISPPLSSSSALPQKSSESFKLMSENCQMENCFNFDKCNSDFKVYVYPIDQFSAPISPIYEKILDSIINSPYYTSDPKEACIFVPSIDTLDRDELSQSYVRNIASRLLKLNYWNNGENHLIFNLYAGTWPNYNETQLGFPLGKAILAKASMSLEQYRPNFDISIPLFHPSHPLKKEDEFVLSNEFPPTKSKQYFIGFKGKRYVYGIGSEARNSLYHLHNGKDVVMVTTCKHGKNWKDMKDERCDQDNLEFEKFDYQTLLQNSTFCLVPRGRRLGSFRFLEALRVGCIPVLLSNSWVLPFSEVVDWTQCLVNIDERTLLQAIDIIRNLNDDKIFFMRQQTQVIYNQYLSNVEKIILTTFEIIRERIVKQSWRDSSIWNSYPGALNVDIDFADKVESFPFYQTENVLRPNYTAIIYVRYFNNNNGGKGSNAAVGYGNTPLFKLIRNIGKSLYVKKILIIWDSPKVIPKIWPDTKVQLNIKRSSTKSISQRFVSTDDEIETDAVFSLDEDAVLTTDELDFAYLVWKSFPDRIVGYPTRSHYWDESKDVWRYSSKWTNDYSLVLTGAALYHSYYNYLYWLKVPTGLQLLIESNQNCEDILINFLAAKITGKSPIKLTLKKNFDLRSFEPDHFIQRQTCLNELANYYGSVPLKRSNIRIDPVLFRDPVSNLRKKYKKLEMQ